MEGLHGASKAPPAPKMVPKSTKNTSTTSPATSESSTLRLLKEGLGVDAQLLDRLPVALLTIVQTRESTCGTQCIPYKIFIGTVKSERKQEDAWAFLSADIRAQDGVPRMLIFSGGQCKPLVKCKSEQLDGEKGGAWSNTFRTVEDSVRRSIFIKTCFVLKGAHFPSDTVFTTKFLKELKVLCRSFPAPLEPPVSYEKPMMARKSQRPVPKGQLFSLPVNPALEHLEDLRATSDTSSTQPAKPPLTEPAAMRSLTATVPPLPPSLTAVNKPAVIEDEPSTMYPDRQALLSPERGISGATIAQTSSTTSTLRSTAVMTPPSEKSDIPLMADGASRYQAARDKMHDTVEQLERIDAAVEANKKKYLKPLEDLKHGIDVEMKQRHESEVKDTLQKLKAKHREEEAAKKEKHQALITEYREHKQQLVKEREIVLQRKHSEEQDAKHQRDSLSREDLLAFLEQDADEKRMRKRRKTKGVHSTDEAA